MKIITLALLLITLASCSKKQADEIYKQNKVSLPFKLGNLVYDDTRSNVVAPEITLSVMPSKENQRTINPELTDNLKNDNQTIINNAFRGKNLTYDLVIVVNKGKKTLIKTWEETKEQIEVEITLELTNKEDQSMYKATSLFDLEVEAPWVSDKHAQEMFETAFKNALYLGLKKVQDELK